LRREYHAGRSTFAAAPKAQGYVQRKTEEEIVEEIGTKNADSSTKQSSLREIEAGNIAIRGAKRIRRDPLVLLREI
jgi:hypothetical protein